MMRLTADDAVVPCLPPDRLSFGHRRPFSAQVLEQTRLLLNWAEVELRRRFIFRTATDSVMFRPSGLKNVARNWGAQRSEKYFPGFRKFGLLHSVAVITRPRNCIIRKMLRKKWPKIISSYLFAQNSTRNLKQSQADNELDGQGSNGALTAT